MKQNLLFNQASALGKRLAMVLTMLLTIGIGTMWGATAEFAPTNFSGQGTSGTGSKISATVNGVTFACDKGYGTTQFRCYSGSTITISSSNTITAISFTFSENKYTGGLETSYTNLSTTSWEQELSSQARITQCVVTYAEASTDPYTVTLEAGSGSVTDTELTEASAGEGVTLPTPTLNGCDDWSFAGWTTSSVATETTSKPNLIAAGTYKPIEDITLYAVYQRTEETEGGGSTTHAFGWEKADDESKWTIFNFSAKGVYSSYKSAGSYAASTNSKTTGYIQYTEKLSPTDISCKYTKATSNTNSSSKFIIQTSTDGSSWTDAATGATMNNVTQGTFKTLSWTGSLSDVYVRIYYTGTNAVRVLDEVSITATGGGGSTTYYHSNPDCTTETVVTLSADESELAFGNVTVNQSSPKTFKLNGSDLIADATLALSGINESMFSVNPNSVTQSDGSITKETITVTYTPTTKASHSASLTISSTGAESIEILLSGTGVAQTANYTVNHYQQNITDDNYTLKETENLSGEVGTKVTPAFKSYEGFTAPTEEKSVEITADGKAIVEYQYARNSYTLTWNLDGGTITTAGTPEGEVKYGASLTAPVVKKDGFNFKGWDPEVPNTMPAANATYTAQWKKKHTIKWIVNGATDTPYATTYVLDGDALALPSNPNVPSTCEEKVFIGWTESANVNADGSDIEYVDENTLPNTDKNYYAVFATPDANGVGSDYKKVTSNLSDWSGEYLIVYETSETAGVAFDGSLDALDNTSNDTKSVEIENESIAATEETNDINFTIGKIENSSNYYIKSASGKYIGRTTGSNGMNISSSDKYPHQISFSDPGWSSSVGEIIRIQSVINGSTDGTPMLLYSETGSRFRYYDSAQEPIALYRKSSYTDYTTTCVETFKVTYEANGATSGNVPVDENNYILDATVTVLGNTENLQKTHYSFVEWNTQADGNGTSYQAGETFTITEDVTLYAIWEELPRYSVTWYVNGKQLTDVELNGASTTVYKGDRITKTPPAPNPEDFCGQVFVGWTDAEMDVNDTNKPTIYNLVDEFPTASGDQTFYAVFADYVTE